MTAPQNERTTWEETVLRWLTTCCGCGESCEGNDDVKEIGVGHVMHCACYERCLIVMEDLTKSAESSKKVASVPIRLTGEEGLTREQIADRRHRKLMRKRTKRK